MPPRFPGPKDVRGRQRFRNIQQCVIRFVQLVQLPELRLSGFTVGTPGSPMSDWMIPSRLLRLSLPTPNGLFAYGGSHASSDILRLKFGGVFAPGPEEPGQRRYRYVGHGDPTVVHTLRSFRGDAESG